MLVFFFMILLIIISIFTLELELEMKKIEYEKDKKKKTNMIYFNIYILKKIKLLKIPLNIEQLKKIEKNKLYKKIDVKTLKGYASDKIKWRKILEKIELKKFNLDLQIGLERADITAYLVVGITSILSFLLNKFIKEYKEKNYYYKVAPIYYKGNYYKMKLDCIIRIKTVHIIYIIYVILKKRRESKNVRTSDRRTYEYSYE